MAVFWCGSKISYRLVQLSRLHKPSERSGYALDADLVEREAHDAVELAHDERQSKTLSVLHLVTT